MKKIILGRTEQKISAISLGTWSYGKINTKKKASVGWSGQSDLDSKNALLKSFASGLNHWDTADVYGDGHAEKIIGSMWTQIPRELIFLATKIGWDKGPNINWYNPNYMRLKMEQSLKNLKTEHVDILYLHHCNFGKNDEFLDGAIEQLIRFKDEGKIRFIGLSDWSSIKIMKYIDTVDPDVVQPLYNVFDIEYETSGLKNYVKKNNIGACFFSPIKHGLLTGKYDSVIHFPQGDFRNTVKEFKDINFIKKMKVNRLKIEKKFIHFGANAIMQSLIGAILFDNPTACVLLGQRNKKQAELAGLINETLTKNEALWILSLFKI
jgi:aryl-alcohol dehydrogenase-like predicted oxidoreductase